MVITRLGRYGSRFRWARVPVGHAARVLQHRGRHHSPSEVTEPLVELPVDLGSRASKRALSHAVHSGVLSASRVRRRAAIRAWPGAPIAFPFHGSMTLQPALRTKTMRALAFGTYSPLMRLTSTPSQA
jgi:hypothetical protein